jgi:hypothetical protein
MMFLSQVFAGFIAFWVFGIIALTFLALICGTLF